MKVPKITFMIVEAYGKLLTERSICVIESLFMLMTAAGVAVYVLLLNARKTIII